MRLTEVSVKDGYNATCNHYRKLVYPLFLTLLVLLLTSSVEAKYSGGSGEPNNPYQIADANDMNEIGTHPEDWGSHFILVNDVNLANYTETEFNLIGVWAEKHDSNNKPFTGVFDGNDHTISNFTYKSNDTNCIGLFVYVDQDAVIKDLTLIDPNIHTGAWWCAGVIVGYLQGGTIQGCGVEGGSIFGAECVGGLLGRNQGMVLDCYVTGIVSRGSYCIGGFVGYNWFGTISNCSAIATVTGDIHHAGGLAGSNRGTISNSWATGTVTGNGIVGGLAGDNSVLGGNISNCYATCTVDGIREVGGLLGENDGGTSTSNCYAAGTVQGDVLVGGLVGQGYGDVYTKCFWDNEINPDINAIGNGTNQNVVGKSTADMKKESTFTDAGWDFVGETANGTDDIWFIEDGIDYPKLWWQNSPVLTVQIDIKPGSCPNPLNVKSSGVLPVAVLGSADVNVLDIDPTSIAFSIGDVNVGAIRCGYEDVATPVSDSNDCNCITDGPDGFLDLTLKFKTQRIVEAIGDVNDGDVLTLELTGVLFDLMPFETHIEGADCIVIRGRHKPINPADINKDGVVNGADFAIFAQNWLQSSIVQD